MPEPPGLLDETKEPHLEGHGEEEEDIARGAETRTSTTTGGSVCVILCSAPTDCPCGLSCRRTIWGTNLCYP